MARFGSPRDAVEDEPHLDTIAPMQLDSTTRHYVDIDPNLPAGPRGAHRLIVVPGNP